MRRVQAVAVPYSIRLGGPHPLRFGARRRPRTGPDVRAPRVNVNDLKWFASAYAAGFVAFSLFIA